MNGESPDVYTIEPALDPVIGLLVQAFYEKKGSTLNKLQYKVLFLFWFQGDVLYVRQKVQKNPPRPNLWKSS